ncbi:MAG TPA: type II secretion system F family protein [Verrucomicrobiae bacterium]|nr:type II secretion system F family protein [Verrucomicrobiae bacterium]
MNTYLYSAVDAQGRETRGTIEVATETEALKRIKEMGFFPLKVSEKSGAPLSATERVSRHGNRIGLKSRVARLTQPRCPPRARIKTITLFTRQLATLLEAGLPLLRSLRLLREQETDWRFQTVLSSLSNAIESGSSFSEALAQHSGIFNRLYLNMVKAGELAGMLETSLKRLADFMEKTARMKSKVKAALFYPAAVVTVATGVIALMLLVIVPRFQAVFADMAHGAPLPAFTRFVLGISETVKSHFVAVAIACAAIYALFLVAIATKPGRRLFDRFKLRMPVAGQLFRKLAIARFARTFGTLITSGVPILQALAIIKDATGNVIVGQLVGRVRDNVEQGESIVGPMRESRIFPAMVVGMVDVGEQTGGLPEMLNKIADTYDDEVDNSVSAMMSLLEPIIIVVLGVVVGAIVIAMFLPIITIIMNGGMDGPTDLAS